MPLSAPWCEAAAPDKRFITAPVWDGADVVLLGTAHDDLIFGDPANFSGPPASGAADNLPSQSGCILLLQFLVDERVFSAFKLTEYEALFVVDGERGH